MVNIEVPNKLPPLNTSEEQKRLLGLKQGYSGVEKGAKVAKRPLKPRREEE